MKFDDGIEVIDNTGRYSVKFPNEEWQPYAHNNELGDGIVGGVFSNESVKLFGVIELTKADDWQNHKQQQKEIESKYNVVESGLTSINGIESYGIW
ncbi:hypothetical protein [Nonlabens xiamenensis]|uniref:hypothetical protein n=1 Tax=Nonlabens xiamenensis TaxID=2341043 RepID=UPI0013DE2A2F|nr:hypothetical protein [Nonlabens xiamenensis]